MDEALTSFISTSYDDTKHSGRFESSQAWGLTSKFVKIIFAELANVQVKARYSIQAEN